MKSHDPGKTDQADKELSQIYQSLDAPEPGKDTDETILNFAKQRILVRQSKPANKRINWTGGFSVAASILAVSVLYWTQFVPETTVPYEPSESPQLASSNEIASDIVNPDFPSRLHEAELSGTAETQVLSKMAASSKQSAAIVSTDSSVELTAVDSEQAQAMDGLQFVQEEALTAPSRLGRANIREKNVSLEPACQLSMQGGYELSSTSLAEYTQNWELADKTWLVNQLNSFKSLTMILESYSGEQQETLKSEGFANAYAEALESLKNCKKTTEPVK